VAKSDRAVARLKPWVPAVEAPRNLPAIVADDADSEGDEPKRKKRRKKERAGELTSQPVQAVQPTIINIVNQVAAPPPVVYAPWWGWRWHWWDGPSDSFWGGVGIVFFVLLLLGLLAGH
jgi:hypothetical protein